ncbi:protein kinase [Nocardia suismassiliense]|uniref:non-specific serine/threonine protein kinase n=1 Tax=Nocardia suismassiliense TaxID=2077092 RepID=A0ABW6QX03_9NOCA
MEAPGPRTGTRFGPYELRSLLGKGGMGEVYEAYDTVKDRVVAVKLLHEELAGDPAYQVRFRRESQAAARVAEPHIVPIHDWGVIDGVLFIDMQLVPGVDLRTLLRKEGPLSPVRAVNIVEQIASALDAAHAGGLVHRDVKPANILVTAADHAFLADFGIAHTEGDSAVTMVGMAVGSYIYMAPERFDVAQVTGRADIYSLSCVLHECLTGASPFPAASMNVLIRSHLSETPPRPSSQQAGIPAGLDAVISRGMAKDPADRWPTASAMALAARAALSSAPSTGVPQASAPAAGANSAGASTVSPPIGAPNVPPPTGPMLVVRAPGAGGVPPESTGEISAVILPSAPTVVRPTEIQFTTLSSAQEPAPPLGPTPRWTPDQGLPPVRPFPDAHLYSEESGGQAYSEHGGGPEYPDQSGQPYPGPAGGPAYSEQPGGQRYSDQPDGQPYSEQPGRNHSEPFGGEPYSGPAGGPPYSDPAGGQRYSDGPGRQPYSDQPEGSPYSDQPGGRQFSDPSEGPGYSGQPGRQPYSKQPEGPSYSDQPGGPPYSDQPGGRQFPDRSEGPGYSGQPGRQPYSEQPGEPYSDRPGGQAYSDHLGGPSYPNDPDGRQYPDRADDGSYSEQPGDQSYSGRPGQPYPGHPGAQAYSAEPGQPYAEHPGVQAYSEDKPFVGGQAYSAAQQYETTRFPDEPGFGRPPGADDYPPDDYPADHQPTEVYAAPGGYTPPEAYSAPDEYYDPARFSEPGSHARTDYPPQSNYASRSEYPEQGYAPEYDDYDPEEEPYSTGKRRSIVLPILIAVVVIVVVAVVGVVGWQVFTSTNVAKPTDQQATAPVPTASPQPQAPGSPSAPPVTSSTPAKTTTAVPLPAGAKPCTQGDSGSGAFTKSATGSAATTCAFAEEVRRAYAEASPGSTPSRNAPRTVVATSPVTGRTYTMNCLSEGQLVTCSGGENAVVYVY